MFFAGEIVLDDSSPDECDEMLSDQRDGCDFVVDSVLGNDQNEGAMIVDVMDTDCWSNPEPEKTALEKTIMIDDVREAEHFREEEGNSDDHHYQNLSPVKGTLSPFKRLSFGRKVEAATTEECEEIGEGEPPVKKRGMKMTAVRINLADLSDPLLPPKQRLVQDEFFGVYCLISKSPERYYRNRCYIGFTVDPNRRIRQHNAGRQAGGAKKTDNRGPWDMVCIVHGFPNAISALRFEWAWQQPKKSRRLKAFALSKQRKEVPFAFCFRIVCHLLNSPPWRELALTFRWLIQEYEMQFPEDLRLPPHMKVAYGRVQKVNVEVPLELRGYTTIDNCYNCKKQIRGIAQLLCCPAAQICGAHFHVRCLAEHCLSDQGLLQQRIVPINGMCPKCSVDFLWGDLVRNQRTLLLVDDSKPEFEGKKIADGMIPRKVQKS